MFTSWCIQNQKIITYCKDKITFTTNPSLSGGETVEIVAETNNLLYEDGNEVLLNGYQNSRSIQSDQLNSSNTKFTNYKSWCRL